VLQERRSGHQPESTLDGEGDRYALVEHRAKRWTRRRDGCSRRLIFGLPGDASGLEEFGIRRVAEPGFSIRFSLAH
jgi:hypothetical protein